MATFNCDHPEGQPKHGITFGGTAHKVIREGRDLVEIRYRWEWNPLPVQVPYVYARRTCPR